jgi:FkbM family methyltransferase
LKWSTKSGNGRLILKKIKRYLNLVKSLGLIEAVIYVFQIYYHRCVKTRFPYRLVSKCARHSLLCRPQTSDQSVFDQIFVERGYRCIDDISDVTLVIDCGANAGYSSAYFLSRFPNSYVVAIEPDQENYLMAAKNLEPYQGRVRLLHSAIWSHPASLKIVESKYRDGREWSRQVRECGPEEVPLFTATDIGSILKESKQDRISILKMDIEGAEGVVFSSPTCKSWIDKVETIAIELHDDSSFGKCSEIFFSVVTKKEFDISRCGELTVCKRQRSH